MSHLSIVPIPIGTKRRIHYVVAILSIVITIYLLKPFGSSHLQWPHRAATFNSSFANATLGFGAIMTISSENTSAPLAWRQSGLVAAANLTGLEVHIALHREPTFKEIKALQTEGDEPHPKDNPALAWAAHLHALEDFVSSAYETVLMVEDDVDWDVSIRESLAAKSPIVSAIRNATVSELNDRSHPYGLNWDVLWLGHCGYKYLNNVSHIIVPDQHILPPSRMRSVLGQGQYRKNARNTRIISTRAAPMCTFAYAVTKEGARKLLERRHRGGKGMDYSTSDGCHWELNCVSVMPELFHHHRKIGGGYEPQILREETELEAAEDARSFTHNIQYSARCNADAKLGTDGEVEETKDGQALVQCLPNEADWTRYNQ